MTITLLTILLTLSFALTGCAKYKARLQSGETITCSIYQEHACGISFYRCDDGRNHECETNVEWVEK